MPTPLKVIRWVPALSVMVMTPDRAPVPCGRKVTVSVQLAPAARVLPQRLFIMKSPPCRLMLAIDSAPLPALKSTTLWGLLGFPTASPPKLTNPLLSNTRAAVPVPCKAIDWLRANRTPHAKPWALKIGYISPHPPFTVPRRLLDLYPELLGL